MFCADHITSTAHTFFSLYDSGTTAGSGDRRLQYHRVGVESTTLEVGDGEYGHHGSEIWAWKVSFSCRTPFVCSSAFSLHFVFFEQSLSLIPTSLYISAPVSPGGTSSYLQFYTRFSCITRGSCAHWPVFEQCMYTYIYDIL